MSEPRAMFLCQPPPPLSTELACAIARQGSLAVASARATPSGATLVPRGRLLGARPRGLMLGAQV